MQQVMRLFTKWFNKEIFVDFLDFRIFVRLADGQVSIFRINCLSAFPADFRIGWNWLSATTQAAVTFNDRYDSAERCRDLTRLSQDLSILGEQLAERIELEDRLIGAASL